MTQPCPTCGKPVDSLRAPAVGVRDGKILGYCSKECAAAAETKPTAAPTATALAAATADAKAKPAAMARRTPVSGVPASAAALDSGPIIEIIRDPASGVVASAATSAAARSPGTRAKTPRPHSEGAIQVAETGSLDDYVDPDDHDDDRRGWSRAGWVVLAVVVVLGGGAFAAYRLGYLDGLLHRNAAGAVVPVAPVAPPRAEPAPAPPPPPPAPSRKASADAVERARVVLRGHLRSDTPRVQRLAAAALSRTGDGEAIAALVAALATETSDIARLDCAYALARAHDKRGLDALARSLVTERRDTKAEAARRLALLGDARAVPVLSEFLAYPQFRLGAAEQLAYVADAKALDALAKLRADPKTSPDDRARAAIGLARGGRTDVAPALRELLADSRFNPFAAAELAALHDPAARPILVKQLAIPSLRVGAARALRRLDPDADVGAQIDALAGALASAKDTEQVQAAEALLLLAGPIAWSERE